MLPVASLNSSFSAGTGLVNDFTAATSRAIVSPCWSVVLTSTCIALQSGLSKPVAVSIGVTLCAITWGSRGSWRHLMLPSLKPAFTIFASPGSEITDCVPGTFCMVQSKVSIAVMMSYCVHAPCTPFVCATTPSVFTPIANLPTMTALSRL